ncbi:MAG: response regulator [Candidatus Omnitrophica bacterium]|nr:response regulator [Candidatus Omnitrophota bacterium]
MKGTKKKILFIEDEPDQRLILSMRLKKGGFAILEAEDGPQGLDLAARENPDLILLDIILPGIDGFEVARRLKKHPSTRRIPIVVATAAGVDDVEHKCFAAGADDCVRKPYDASELLEKIWRLLGK